MENTNQSTQRMDNPELLTRDEVAQLLHVSLSFIDHLNDLPSYKLGKKKLFNKAEVLEYSGQANVKFDNSIITQNFKD